MNNKQIEEIFNQTFGGLTLFYRDTTLSEKLISKYQVGQVLTEPGFTDMTYKGGGLSTNFRYLIASANGKDISAFNPNTAQFGHIVLSPNAFFKVLDIYKIWNKTQVFLLEIPSNAIDLFKSVTSNIEEDIVKKARESFDNKINTVPIPLLQTEEWKQITEFPIGMSDKGELFYQSDIKMDLGISKLYVCTANDEHILEMRPHNNICPFCPDKSFVFMYEITDTHSRWEGVIQRYKNL